MQEHLSILNSLFKNFQSTGTIFPSSRFLAQAMVKGFKNLKTGINVLEVGAGTGPITRVIIEEMSELDRLTICEMNEDLLAILKPKLTKNPYYQNLKQNIKLFESAIQELDPANNQFDAIICSLPFLNFPTSLSEEIFKKLHALAKPECKFCYFSYLGGKSIGSMFNAKRAASRDYLNQQQYFSLVNQETVWLNLLPAQVNFLEKTN